MTNVPHAIVDFAAALKMLASAQSDIAEIVTKWDLICDTTTPRTVKIELSDGIHEVDNLAKIREDLVKGLSLDNPEVYSLKLKTKYGPGTGYLHSTYFASKSWFASSDSESSFKDPYEKYESYWGCYRNMRNTFYSCCMGQKSEIHINFLELSRYIWLGYPASPNDPPIQAYSLYIKSPSPSNTVLAQGGRQYCAVVTFIGAYTNQAGTAPAGAVTLHIYHVDGSTATTTVTIEFGKTATFIMWAAPGQNQVNVQRIHEQEFTD